MTVTTQALHHQSEPLYPPTEVLLLVRKPWRDKTGQYNEAQKKLEAISMNLGWGREGMFKTSIRGAEGHKSEQADSRGILSFQIFLSISSPLPPCDPEAAIIH